MKDLINRLRGIYIVAVDPTVGPLELEDGSKATEFKRTFQTPPINHEAADTIEKLVLLVEHMWIHDNYHANGYKQMTTEQKELWRSITTMTDEAAMRLCS